MYYVCSVYGLGRELAKLLISSESVLVVRFLGRKIHMQRRFRSLPTSSTVLK